MAGGITFTWFLDQKPGLGFRGLAHCLRLAGHRYIVVSAHGRIISFRSYGEVGRDEMSKHGFPTRASFVKAVSAEVFAHLPKPAPAAAAASV